MPNGKRRRAPRAAIKELEIAIDAAIKSDEKVQSLIKNFFDSGHPLQLDVLIRFPSPPRRNRGRKKHRELVKDGEITDEAFDREDNDLMHQLGIGPVSE